MNFINSLLYQFKNRNPHTVILKSTKTTQIPILNDDTNENLNQECNHSNSINTEKEKDLPGNSTEVLLNNKIIVEPKDGDDTNSKLRNADQGVEIENFDDECIDVEEYLQLNIITVPTVDGNETQNFHSKEDETINENLSQDLEDENYYKSNKDTSNILNTDDSQILTEIAGSYSGSEIPVDDLKFDQETTTKETSNILSTDDNDVLKEINSPYSSSQMLVNESKLDHEPGQTANNLHIDEVNNIEIVSISSDDDCKLIEDMSKEIKNITDSKNQCINDTNYDSDCSGYHSSDFEFITESEAKLQGLIKNKNSQTSKNNIEPRPSSSKIRSLPWRYTDHGAANEIGSRSQGLTLRNRPKSKEDNKSRYFGENLPNLGHSVINSPNFGNSINRNYYRPGPSFSNNAPPNNRPIHNAIPDGEEYFNMFRGIYDPAMPLCTIHMMENKSVRTTGMNVEFEGLGFDMRLMRNYDNSSQEEFEVEAEESVKKILRMYPGDNKKRRRRRE